MSIGAFVQERNSLPRRPSYNCQRQPYFESDLIVHSTNARPENCPRTMIHGQTFETSPRNHTTTEHPVAHRAYHPALCHCTSPDVEAPKQTKRLPFQHRCPLQSVVDAVLNSLQAFSEKWRRGHEPQIRSLHVGDFGTGLRLARASFSVWTSDAPV